MSKTLFWYVFKDLLKIFLLASGGLAGIMSFGGLLRPITEHGLDSSQVGKILTYFLPAMTTYSLPIAALFATTMVYGRIAGDNEITACRASGISYLAMAMPAIVLGLIVAIVSLLFLCFIVPVFTLKVEQVIYSNLARIAANQIESKHKLELRSANTTIFAQRAYIPPADQVAPGTQVVTLIGPLIINYTRDESGRQIPTDFMTARQATAYITREEDSDDVMIQGTLEGGMKFPREFRGAVQGGIERQEFGPILYESPVKEDPKFMDINRLKELNADKGKSRDIRSRLQGYIRRDQTGEFLRQVRQDLMKRGTMTFTSADGRESVVIHQPDITPSRRDGMLVLSTSGQADPRGLRVRLRRDGQLVSTTFAEEIHILARPDSAADEMVVTIEMHNAVVRAEGQAIGRIAPSHSLRTAMPGEVRGIEDRGIDYYLPRMQNTFLHRQVIKLGNGIESELHGRASFAVSCFMLVLVGCALGMMFKSGNLLSAFTVSVIPALICLTLIATGQQICENVPMRMQNFQNPLQTGLIVIWSGNAIICVIATTLLWRLQRQ